MNALGSSYIVRFECRSGLSDVNKRIHWPSESAFLTPETHADKPNWNKSLGALNLSRSDFHGEIPDLDQAMDCQSRTGLLTVDDDMVKSVRLRMIGHAGKSGRFNGLANSYQS